MTISVVFVLLAIVLTGCTEPLEFADWAIAVPEGTRVIEYEAVPIEGRTDQIEFVENLSVGGREGDPNQTFYRPADVAVDAMGRMYVLDRGNYRVQVFDAEGGFVTTWGRQGEGPAEFANPRWIAVAGDRVAVLAGGQRLSVWDAADGHLADHRLWEALSVVSFAGTPEGTLVVAFHTYPDARQSPDEQQRAIGFFTLEGRETRRLGEFEDPSGIFEISLEETVAEGCGGQEPRRLLMSLREDSSS